MGASIASGFPSQHMSFVLWKWRPSQAARKTRGTTECAGWTNTPDVAAQSIRSSRTPHRQGTKHTSQVFVEGLLAQ